MTRVLIADDQALLCESFRVLLEAEPGIRVVGTADDGNAAVRMALRHRPDVVLMDVRMPGLDGIAATRRIREDPGGAATRVLMLTMFDLDTYVFSALRAGASGFLLKDIAPAQLLEAVRVVATGESLLTPAITRRLIAEFCRQPVNPPRAHADLAQLSARETEVLVLVTRGFTNAEIADELRLATATVKSHIGRLLEKTGSRDRVQLVILGYEYGLVSPERRG